MYKNKIKDFLTDRFLNEVNSNTDTPGISVTNSMHTKSGKINKDGIKDTESNLKDYDKSVKKSAEGTKNMPQNKFNYNGESEETYHAQMEIMNGQEMIEYDRKPEDKFTDRAIEAIEGSSNMGNNPEWANVVPQQQGFTGPTFGKNLVKAIKASHKKRQDATDSIISFGDDIETVPKGSKPIARFSALGESIEDKENKDKKDNLEDADISGDDYEKTNREIENNTKKDNKKPIKESMKRLIFNKEFKGVGNALKMIPESYKVDNKEFEMTDKNEVYKIRWEGTLTEGRAIVLMASDKTMLNENMQKMKHLINYKAQDTLGLVKGNARVNENAVFGDIWTKSKLLIEGEDIEGQTAPEDEWEKTSKKAPEATKHVEGSTSTDKGTKAPAAKTGSADSLEKVKKQAPEAKKDIHMGKGTGEAKIGMGLGDQSEGEGEWDQMDIPQAAAHGNPSKTAYAPAPKTGEWEKISVPQSSDAKKHVHMSEGVQLGDTLFTPMNVDELFK